MNFKWLFIIVCLLFIAGCSANPFLLNPLFTDNDSPLLLSSPVYTTAEAVRLGSLYKQPLGGGSLLHPGIDIQFNVGGRVKAAAFGIVSALHDNQDDGGPTKIVIIQHNKKYATHYCFEPLGQLFVKVGDMIQGGQIIGTIGSHEGSSANGLHFAVTNLFTGSMYNCPMTFWDQAARAEFRALYNQHSVVGLIDPCYEHTTAEGYPSGCPSLFGQL